jgi:hypothetical protein
MSNQVVQHLLVLRMEQLKVDTNDLPSVTKKKVTAVAASVSSTEAFPTAELPHQLEVPTAVAASIPSRKVGGVLELWLGWSIGGGGGQYSPGGGGH